MEIVVERKIIRQYITKTFNEVTADVDTCKVNMDKFRLKCDRLEELNREMKDYMKSKDTSEEEWTKELSVINDYEDKIFDIYNCVKPGISMDHTARKNIPDKCKVNLPVFTIPKFNGDLKTWNLFWNQFKKIDNNEDLDNDIKFSYLVQNLEGPPKQLLESYQVVGNNYEKALAELKGRFAREDLLIDIYIRELMSTMITQLKTSKFKLSDLYDNLMTKLNNLEALSLHMGDFSLILVPIIEACLPIETLKLWERIKNERVKSNLSISGNKLEELLMFLKDEVETEQKLSYVSNCVGTSEFAAASLVSQELEHKGKRYNTDEKGKGCIFCSKNHYSNDCMVTNLSIEEKEKVIFDKKACKVCLKVGHFSRNCKAFVRCILCKGRHFPIICRKLEDKEEEKETTVNLVSSSPGQVYLQTLQVFIIQGQVKYKARVLLDGACHFSYIKTSTVNGLKIPSIGETTMLHGLFGGVTTKAQHKQYVVQVQSLDGAFQNSFVVLDQEQICHKLPKLTAEKINQLHEVGVKVTDVEDGPEEIEILLGADNIPYIMTNQIRNLTEELMAVQTLLGWTVIGRFSNSFNSTNISSSLCSISDFWSLECLGIKEGTEVKTKKDLNLKILDEFKSNLSRDGENRYLVHLPFKSEHITPESNKDQALSRLKSVRKKLDLSGKFNDYHKVLKSWEKEGVVERVADPKEKNNYFLPHRPVIKESSMTTKIRPVFDGGATSVNGLSLNDCLEKGVNLIEDMPSLLTKWRLKKYAAQADIKSAFLSIGITPEDRKWLQFLWYGDNDEIVIMRHRRLVFGLISSPFILKATINFHVEKETACTKIAEDLKNSFYCDNLLVSCASEVELSEFIKQAYKLLLDGKFLLREWCLSSNANECEKEIVEILKNENVELQLCNHKPVKVLGLQWDPDEDEIFLPNMFEELKLSGKAISKRLILSCLQKVFDPIGILAPITIAPKLLLRELWTIKSSWDESVSEEFKIQFLKWVQDVQVLSKIKIDRWLQFEENSEVTVHVFSDASAVAYGACIFLRVEKKNRVTVKLVIAKGRVAPIKNGSIPKLELLGCLVGVRLMNSLKTMLPECPVYHWTDSTVALDWINNRGKLDVYVRNRVNEISKYTSAENWNHVAGKQNPADILTRPRTADVILNSRWWEGPEWLKGQLQKDSPMETANLINNSESSTEVDEDILEGLHKHFSSYSKFIRSVSWMLRFVKKSKKVSLENGDITNNEFKETELFVFKYIQRRSRVEEKMRDTELITDGNGTIRVKTRLLLGDFTENFKTPILLPGDNPIVHLLIRHYHLKNNHAGRGILNSILRENYVITKQKKLVKTVLKECVTCRKVEAKHLTVKSAPLPAPRINLVACFEITGLDCTGPLYLKTGEKTWVLLFTCAVFRAVHLELLSSMSTECFMMGFRRFIARRGRPRIIYSDNGSNFLGFRNGMVNLELPYDGMQPMEWRLIPPASPWWGGFYERLNGVLKNLLKKCLGRSNVNYEELNTVLASVESTMNDRPLSYVYSAPHELLPLTPAMFAREAKLNNEAIEIDMVEESKFGFKTKHLNDLRKQLKERFRSEYLTGLVEFKKGEKGSVLEVGEIVLVEAEGKRISWPLGRVMELVKGVDGEVRVAKVYCNGNILVRPLQRLYSLEVRPKEIENNPVEDESKNTLSVPIPDGGKTMDRKVPNKTSRAGRVIRPPVKLDI